MCIHSHRHVGPSLFGPTCHRFAPLRGRARGAVPWRLPFGRRGRRGAAWDSLLTRSASLSGSWPARDSTTTPESPTKPARRRRRDLLPRGSDPRIEPAPRESQRRRRGCLELWIC
ncbi:unnamed protein product [Urochloa humidicola]